MKLCLQFERVHIEYTQKVYCLSELLYRWWNIVELRLQKMFSVWELGTISDNYYLGGSFFYYMRSCLWDVQVVIENHWEFWPWRALVHVF